MGWPVVVVAKGGIPVSEASNGRGTPLSIATNGFGTPVTVVGSGGLPVLGSGGAPANQPPVAVADSGYSTSQNTALLIAASALLANDSDPDGDPLTVTGVGGAVNGTVSFNSGTGIVTFTPTASYTGPASFTYAISDGRGGTASATVSLTVTAAANLPPVAVDDSGYTTPINTALTIPAASLLANDTDPDSDPLTVTGVSSPVNGTVSLISNVVTFTPTTGYTGSASFTYAISDGRGGTDTATVSLTVEAVEGPGEPVTIFTQAPALGGTDANPNTCFRIACTTTGPILDEFRVTLTPGTAGMAVANAGASEHTGDVNFSDCTGPIIEALFSGVSGFAMTTSPQTSDWMPAGHLTDKPTGTKVLVSWSSGVPGQGGVAYVSSSTNSTGWYKTGTPEYWDEQQTSSPVLGFSTISGINYGVSKIETRTAGSTPPSGIDIPIGWDDPIFTSMTEITAPYGDVAFGTNLTRISITEQSGDSSIVCKGNNTVSYCRVYSREAVRVTGGFCNIHHCYLEAEGLPDIGDHADTVQHYEGGGSPSTPAVVNGVTTVTNCHIVGHDVDATAAYFVSDFWDGSVTFENVIFQSGPYGLKVSADPNCHIDVSLKNCYFIPPFPNEWGEFNKVLYTTAPGEPRGTMTITKWENVRFATIVGGELIPGSAIPQPTPGNVDYTPS